MSIVALYTRSAFAIASLLLCSCVVPPERLPQHARTPIRIGEGGTPPIYFEKVVYRLPVGYRYGTLHDRSGNETGTRRIREAHGETERFNIQVSDRMKDLGYSSVDPTEAIFSQNNTVKARFRLVGVVTDLDIHSYRSRNYRKTYKTVSLAMDVRLYDAAAKDVVYARTFTGTGFDDETEANAQSEAVLNALDGALQDEEFVAKFDIPGEDHAPEYAAKQLPECPNATMVLPRDASEALESVVTIRVGSSHGSGVMISPAGHVLTAAHVVSGASRPIVKLSGGEEFEAKVSRIDERWDVALLDIPGRRHHCALLRTENDQLSIGASIFAIGSPVDESLSGSVTRGILSGRPRIDGVEWLQTDASINPGSSGGPLMDAQGRVVGIVSMKAIGVGLEGVALAVPAEAVLQSLALSPE